MVIRLGTYLRIAGYDADWDLDLSTRELVQRANAGNRLFVTRNTRLPHQYPMAARLLIVAETDPVLQFRTVVRTLDLDPQTGLFSRCVRCNVPLAGVADPESIRDRIHPGVFARQHRFFKCPRCGTVFWHGSHVRNTCRKLGLNLPETAAGMTTSTGPRETDATS